IIDDVIVYCQHPDRFIVVANAGNRDAVADAFAERRASFPSSSDGDVEVEDWTERIALVAVQGPAAQRILEATAELTDYSTPLYGHELSLDIVPAQAGLGRVVVEDKDRFVGKEGLAAADLATAPVLVGLTADGRRAGRAGYGVFDGETRIGEITSGALSPTLG